MRCHYDVLNVEKEASEGDIKTAYKKLALKWHPDKNLQDVENAKEQFQLVQQAYEVLSDKQERAWYDRHREQILHGSNTEFADNNLDVFQYFTTSCFKGYGDDENGFYTVYRLLFEKIAKEDMDFYDVKEEFCNIPSFGTSSSDYDTVVHPFYAHWMSYSTKKSYVWLDPYGIKDIRDRRLLKAVEKENKKVRQKAKKERNEEIRNLVAFVRKRDKRVQEWNRLNEEKIKINRNKQEQIRKQKLEARRKMNESEVQAEWTKFENVTSELNEIEKNLEEQFGNSDLSDTDNDDLYCAACNKLFRTEKSFQNHESSKKHKENVEILRTKMLAEDEEYGVESEEEISLDEDVDELRKELSSEIIMNGESIEESPSEEDIEVETEPKKKKNKKFKQARNHIPSESESDSEYFLMTKKQSKQRKSNILKLDSSNDESKLPNVLPNFSENDDLNSTKNKVKRKNRRSKKVLEKKTTSNNTVPSAKNLENFDEEVDFKSEKLKTENTENVLHICVTCKKDFPSKNKLFQHLKKEGHSEFLPANQARSTKSNKHNRKK